MDSNYKLHVKLGSSEFDGEGPEGAVKDAYQQFLQALSSVPPPTPTPILKPVPFGDLNMYQKPSGVADELLNRAFLKEGEIVSLRHMPPADRPNRNADAAILILYGYKKLLGQDDVLVTKLNEALRRSGITMERVDRFITANMQLYRKGGQKSGGRYALNNLGESQAEAWLTEWFN